MHREDKFQAKLIKEIKDRFPGCIVIKGPSNYIQGIPDLLILHDNHWAALECKRSLREVNDIRYHQPNQDYYIGKMSKMSFASFISPENKEEVLNAVQQSFESSR